VKNELSELARSSNAFGFDLYQRLRRTPGNLVVSPASLTLALAMTWGGAKGETAAEMKKVLHLEGTADDVMEASGALARSLQDPSRPLIFRIANQLFGETSYELVPAYLEKVRTAYGAPLELVDFKEAPEPARRRINGWVEEKTEQRIKDLIPPNGVNDLTRLVLVNAIYFLGDWAEPFDPHKTHPAPFHLSASETNEVPTMHSLGRFRIAQKSGVTALEIPYAGESLSMLLLVPDAVDGLAALEAALDAQRLDALTSALTWDLVAVAMPKFEVNPRESLSLGDDLEALGMPLAFDDQRADFTGLANPPDPADRLFITKVFHKGFVRVDEKGTEAAAATAVILGLRGLLPSLPRQLNADRPFLFLIRDNASGLIVFLGRVSDPSQT
jgi:serpin B